MLISFEHHLSHSSRPGTVFFQSVLSVHPVFLEHAEKWQHSSPLAGAGDEGPRCKQKVFRARPCRSFLKPVKLRLEGSPATFALCHRRWLWITQHGRHTRAGSRTKTWTITSIEDLTRNLSTFGFRSVALHSLRYVSDVVVATRCDDEATAEWNWTVVKSEHCTVPPGTSIIVPHLLCVFPASVCEERVTFRLTD